MATAFSVPASASPKSNCEAGLRKAEARFNSGVDRSQVDKVRKSITNARTFRDKGKFKKCAAITKKINKQLGTK